jgi:hypothetical protein
LQKYKKSNQKKIEKKIQKKQEPENAEDIKSQNNMGNKVD